MLFGKVAILGVGLIGASFALALREKGLCSSIWGYGRSEDNLKRATKMKIVDEFSLDAKKSCEDADLIVLATPVGKFGEIAAEVKNAIKRGALVTDVGSVKGGLVALLEALMPEGAAYVGSHPIAGGDRSGIDDARPDLFSEALCIVTPTEGTDRDALRTIASLWEKLGSTVEMMDPFRHDEVYAAVSHFPHVIAYALVNAVNEFDGGCIGYAGQGFKDTTRIALSSPEMWRDIAIFNRENLVRLIGVFRKDLDEIEGLLDAGDAQGIERVFARARGLRMKLTEGGHMPEVEGSDSMISDRGL